MPNYTALGDSGPVTWVSPIVNKSLNGSDNASASTDGEMYSNHLSDIIGIWVIGLICLLGFAGNTVSFIVLLRAFARSPMFYVLRAVAVSDTVFLFTVIVLNTFVNLHPQIAVMEWCFKYRGYIQYAAWPVMMMTQMSTVWLTVLVSLERYVAICYPLKAAAMCTIPKARKAVIIIFTVSVVFNVPRYFEYTIVDSDTVGKSDIGTHEIYRYLYSCAAYSIMLFFLPLLLLLFLNLKLVLALQRGKKQWQTLQNRQKKEQNLTIIPMTIVLIFFICGTPSLAVNVIESMNSEVFNNASFITFLVIANLLVVLNSASNFVIYCFLGKTFRNKLMQICWCSWCGDSNYRVVHHLVNTQISTTDLHHNSRR